MDNVSELHRRIEFTIDSRAYTMTDHNQPAADLLRLGSLDPARFELSELGPRLRRAARRSRVAASTAVVWRQLERRPGRRTGRSIGPERCSTTVPAVRRP